MKPADEFPFHSEEAAKINRRGVLKAGVAGVVAVAGGEWLGSLLEPNHSADLVEVAHAETIAVGKAMAAKSVAANADVLVVRLDAETMVAFDRRCPHLGCPVLWSAERARFECPCHKACFEARSGAVISGPARRGLTPVSIHIQEAAEDA